jgi:hypothetical protein
VIERLTGSFPDINAADVDHVVHRSYKLFDGKPIRDFVPVLVERMARNDLLAQRHHLATTGPQTAGAAW